MRPAARGAGRGPGVADVPCWRWWPGRAGWWRSARLNRAGGGQRLDVLGEGPGWPGWWRSVRLNRGRGCPAARGARRGPGGGRRAVLALAARAGRLVVRCQAEPWPGAASSSRRSARAGAGLRARLALRRTGTARKIQDCTETHRNWRVSARSCSAHDASSMRRAARQAAFSVRPRRLKNESPPMVSSRISTRSH